MKFDFQGYIIDTEKETDFTELNLKLTFLLRHCYPALAIKFVDYSYCPREGSVTILIGRPSLYDVIGDWVSSGDCQILTGYPEECFLPGLSPVPGPDPFGLIGVGRDYYACGEMLCRHLLAHHALSGISSISVSPGPTLLSLRLRSTPAKP